MTREAPEFDALLRPLATRGAPAGFAARLQARYAQAMETRRRRTAIAIALASCAVATVLVLVVAFVSGATLVDLARDSTAGLGTAFGALFRAAWRPFVALGSHLALGVVASAAFFAATCVAIAALVRHETAREERAQ